MALQVPKAYRNFYFWEQQRKNRQRIAAREEAEQNQDVLADGDNTPIGTDGDNPNSTVTVDG